MDEFISHQSKLALYSLKRQYGASVDIYKAVSSVANLSTGVRSVVPQVTHVERAIILPTKVTRELRQTISAISANKQFVYGGYYDDSARTIIIDREDVELQLNKDDWVVYRNKRWQVDHFYEYEFDAGYVVEIKHVLGTQTNAQHSTCVEDFVKFQNTAQRVP